MLVLLEAKTQLFYSRYIAGLAVCSFCRLLQFFNCYENFGTTLLFLASSSCLNKKEILNLSSGMGNGQASHITGGIYMKPPQPDGLFEYLMVHDISYLTSEICVNISFRLSFHLLEALWKP